MDQTTMLIVTMGGLFALMYFMQIRPNQKRQKERAQMLQSIAVGAKIVTIGGFHGIINEVNDDYFVIELVPGGVLAKIRKDSVYQVTPDETDFEDDEDEEDTEDEV